MRAPHGLHQHWHFLTAIGTVGAVVVALGIALWADKRADRRINAEHERSDRLLREERERSASALAEQREHERTALEEERAYGGQQLEKTGGLHWSASSSRRRTPYSCCPPRKPSAANLTLKAGPGPCISSG
jgi:hypothetical protein